MQYLTLVWEYILPQKKLLVPLKISPSCIDSRHRHNHVGKPTCNCLSYQNIFKVFIINKFPLKTLLLNTLHRTYILFLVLSFSAVLSEYGILIIMILK